MRHRPIVLSAISLASVLLLTLLGGTALAQRQTSATPDAATSPSPATGGNVANTGVTGGPERAHLDPVKSREFPAQPALFDMQATADAMRVSWHDGTINATDLQVDHFDVYRRDLTGAWRVVHTVPANHSSSNPDYSWIDTEKSLSAQCYMIAAVAGERTFTKEYCKVRPDPNAFPQHPPAAVAEWYGLSRVNDSTAPLFNQARNQYLKYGGQTFGINLAWGYDGNNVKVERQGTGTTHDLMFGERVAIRVWGGGWLKYGLRGAGPDLEWSPTPAYEWYVIADPISSSYGSGSFALWNKSANDYLVKGSHATGIDLNWYKLTQPQPTPPTPPSSGVKTLVTYNCHSSQRPVEMWILDATSGGQWTDIARIDSQWVNGGCPAGGQPWVFTPTPGHTYYVEAVDLSAPGCSNDPNIGGCWRTLFSLTGDAGGGVATKTVS